MNIIEQTVYDFNFNQDMSFDNCFYNKWFIFDTVGKHNVLPYYKILKKVNRETFEYGGKSTYVEIVPLYINSKGILYSRVFIKTKDDACLNLWMPPQTEKVIHQIKTFIKNLKKLESCVDTYEKLTKKIKSLNLPSYEGNNYKEFQRLMPLGFDVDFN